MCISIIKFMYFSQYNYSEMGTNKKSRHFLLFLHYFWHFKYFFIYIHNLLLVDCEGIYSTYINHSRHLILDGFQCHEGIREEASFPFNGSNPRPPTRSGRSTTKLSRRLHLHYLIFTNISLIMKALFWHFDIYIFYSIYCRQWQKKY